MSVTAVLTTIRSVSAAMWASSVVGDEEKNGGVWGSPIADTSSPTSSARRAISAIASMRSASLRVWPRTGVRVVSLAAKIPNCIAGPPVGWTHNYGGYMPAHVLPPRFAGRGEWSRAVGGGGAGWLGHGRIGAHRSPADTGLRRFGFRCVRTGAGVHPMSDQAATAEGTRRRAVVRGAIATVGVAVCLALTVVVARGA